jgi:hypothetical protein
LYRELLGFNDKDEGLSYMVRDGQVTREEALTRLDDEAAVPEAVVQEVLGRSGVDLADLEADLEKNRDTRPGVDQEDATPAFRA